jgi:hypothetical protein
MKKLLSLYSKIKWFIAEIGKIYSNEDSYFSKKRIESGVAFIIGQWGMIYFLVKNITTMTTSDVAIWSGVEFALAGYMISQIQKEKKTDEPKEENN